MAATRTTRPAARTRRKATPEPEELEDDLEIETEDEDEDETEDDEDEAPAPKKRPAAAKKAPAKKAAAPVKKDAPAKETLGTVWLKEHVNDTLGTDHESTKLRIILRKLIKDQVIDSPKDGRYVFAGPRDPNVKAVIAALREEQKSGPAKRGRKPKSKVAAEEIDDDETEVEDLDLDDEE